MGQALYRKYRSKSLDEIVGQEHITTTLKHALKNGKLSHAYLLTGPRGVGKTSIARILAHEINGLPYGDEAHLDIIEIDAASNRRIDEIRDLRDKVNTAPANAKYKVYIIDEVHMLTKEAFNALLKTLEEPPAHVVFVLATTEAHKLPETIISRTQRYSFRPVPREQVVAHLKEIAKKEKIDIDDGALGLIAEHGEGSFRDSISLLDQASNHEGQVTQAVVEQMLGLAPTELVQSIVTELEAHDAEGLVSTLADLQAQGFEPAMVAAQLGEVLRTQLLAGKLRLPSENTFHLLQQLLGVSAARDPKRMLELALLETLFATSGQVAPVAATPAVPAEKPKKPASKPVEAAPVSKKEAPAEPEEPTAKAKLAHVTDTAALWPKALDAIKKKHNTLYGVARMAHPEFDGDQLTLRFGFAFHQKRCNESKNRAILVATLEELSGQTFQIRCVVDKDLGQEPPAFQSSDESEIPPAETPRTETVSTISNIFGGAELLES